MASEHDNEEITPNYEAINTGAATRDHNEQASSSRRPTVVSEMGTLGDSSEITDDGTLRRVSTSRSTLEQRIFVPINPGDTAELVRIATKIERTKSGAANGEIGDGADLEKKDTLYGIALGDPVVDPTHKDFDVYKWARMFIKLANENNIVERRAGFTFKTLKVTGSGAAINLQKNVGSVLMAPLRVGEFFGKGPEKTILNSFDGILKSGEMLIVLGRPGSGCSTLLKTITGELHGLNMHKDAVIHYNGIPQQKMLKQFKGELVYNQEVDKHFPHLTVGETLEFAARVRTPQNRPGNYDRETYAKYMAQVSMAVFGLSHTYNTKVGDDFVRGVSGGERKRVSIAEMALAGSPIAAWDNATRGLDAATALEFTRSLRMSANLSGSCHAVAIYQASQAIYNEFDKCIVLYEGRQIYFGLAAAAKQYFVDMGYECPPRQTVGDFLTSVTNPQERRVRGGFEKRVPRTPDDFEKFWKASQTYKDLMQEIDEHEEEFPIGGEEAERIFKESRLGMQAKHVRPESPYTVSIAMQVRYCTQRAYQRLWNDKTSSITKIVGQIAMALIIGSIFYGTPNTTSAFFQKGGVLFFAVLLNALMAITEINTLYAQRPIVEKQASYAFYHPFAEALAGIVSDIPLKLVIAVSFNIILYFLAGLRREPAQFFIFFLFNFVTILTMSMIFRTVAASTKTISQALAIAGVSVLAVVIYTGFTIPRPYMHPWFKWISWINPVAYAFEALIVNELHGQIFDCSFLVPSGPGYSQIKDTFICATAGAVAGQTSVSGDAYLDSQFQYSYSHIWRNLGFLFAFLIFFLVFYLVATELNSSTDSSAEVLVFRRGHVPKKLVDAEKAAKNDEEAPLAATLTAGRNDAEQEREQNEQVKALKPQTDIFSWKNVNYDIKIKGEPRKLLDNVSGWVKPGTLTALMGVSGAGKTTLLDVLAQRVSMGVITGDMLVSGKPLDESFQRKTGYVQQQDLHLETTTVREALRFSALLRQPKSVSKKEKYEFVEDVIKMLSMGDFAEAVVGVPGQGLNVEQRKLLTIGVELAAKPALLLFLDEPTSGLDSQSAWAIVAFLRKLADNGQAVLATIHQPSAILFQEFDRLLFLAKGGKTVYFGDIGDNSATLLQYFASNGAEPCGPDDNPAEYMLTMVGAGPSGKTTRDWHQVWKDSQEAKNVQTELDRIKQEMGSLATADNLSESHSEFAMPFSSQLIEVTKRVFQQYWRTPEYIYSKLLLGIASALFIGFSFFQADASMQGLQNVIFSIFLLTSIFTTLVQQIMPRFITQRDLYEVRERPSKAYSWKAFLIANIVVEIPWQILLGVAVFASFYYPVFGIQPSDRQCLVLLFCVQFFVFASTFAHMLISSLPDAETAGQYATLMFSLTLTFNGVFQPPQALPGFWIFMYRISPLTYLVGGVVSTGLHDRVIQCATNELAVMQPPLGKSCGEYLQPFADLTGGSVYNPTAMQDCQYCAEVVADQFLTNVSISYGTRWRDFGLGFAYILFNICVAVLLYYFVRVRKGSGRSMGERFGPLLGIFGKGKKTETEKKEKGKSAVAVPT